MSSADPADGAGESRLGILQDPWRTPEGGSPCKHPIEAFSSAAPNPALGVRISSGRHQRSQDRPSTLRLKDAVGLRRELLVAIVDQDAELDSFVLERPTEIAGLLADPSSIRG